MEKMHSRMRKRPSATHYNCEIGLPVFNNIVGTLVGTHLQMSCVCVCAFQMTTQSWNIPYFALLPRACVCSRSSPVAASPGPVAPVLSQAALQSNPKATIVLRLQDPHVQTNYLISRNSTKLSIYILYIEHLEAETKEYTGCLGVRCCVSTGFRKTVDWILKNHRVVGMHQYSFSVVVPHEDLFFQRCRMQNKTVVSRTK